MLLGATRTRRALRQNATGRSWGSQANDSKVGECGTNINGHRRDNAEHLAAAWMAQGDGNRMQRLALERRAGTAVVTAIHRIAHDRVTDMREVNSDLMFPPCLRPEPQNRKPRS